MRRIVRAVLVGALVNATFAVPPAGAVPTLSSIEGLVRDAGVASPGICVTALDARPIGPGHRALLPSISAATGADGRYRLNDVSPGTYNIRFRDCAGAAHLEQWYDHQTSQATARAVSVVVRQAVRGIDADLAPNLAHLRGTVSNASGGPIPGVCVDAFDRSGSTTVVTSTTLTSGSYDLAVRGGAYKLRFSGCGASPWAFVAQWYHGAATAGDADVLEVAPGAVSAGLDVVLGNATGSFSGRVTDTDGSAVSGICVSARGANGGSLLGSGSSTGDGAYQVSGFPAGTVEASFADCEGNDYLQGRVNGTVTISPGQDTHPVDIVVTAAGSVSGTVTAGGDGAGDVCVLAEDAATGDDLGTDTTDANGAYTVSGLPHTAVALHFSDCSPWDTRSLISAWYPGVDERADASEVDVDGASADIDIALTSHAALSGIVTLDGTPVVGLCVEVYRLGDPLPSGSTMTDYYGRYRIGGLRTGTGQVRFRNCFGTNYREGWYDSLSGDRADAKLLPLSDGVATELDQVELATTGGIAGRVTAGSGTGISSICVDAYDAGGTAVDHATTAGDGRYSIGGLAPGSYRVRFRDCNSGGSYNTEWYDNAASIADAQAVVVARGARTTGVDASLSAGGTIRGRVRNAGGAGLAGACVYLSLSGVNPQLRFAQTAADGSFRIDDVFPATGYTVRFDDCSLTPHYVAEYYDNKTDSFSATPVAVATGQVVVLNDAVLDEAGAISGTVSGPERACVSASGPAGSFSAISDENGNYMVAPVRPGAYRVSFSECASPLRGYIAEYWNDAVDFNSATPVNVVGGATTTGVNASLSLGATISGVLTDGVTPLGDVCVQVQGSTGGFGSDRSTANGEYRVTGLRAGGYRVNFSDCANGDRGYLSEYWNDAASFNDATLVELSAGETRTDVNATLTLGARISGTVIGPTGVGLASVCIDPSGPLGSPPGRVMTNAAGNYVLSGLRSGSYKLRFSDCSTPPRNLASEWWNDAATTATATSIDLTAGQVVDGINAALVTGGSIVGTVQNAGGAGIPGICVTAGSSTAGTSGSATTSANGTYSVVGLRGGADYVVSFSDCRIAREYLGEYFHNATFANSARVDVATGAPTTVDETLVKGGTVSGLVTGPGGGPVANACVSAFLGTMEATATTGSDGRYTIRALPSGTYRVRVRDCGYPTPQNLALAWFGGTNGRTAQPLDVVVESGVGGVDVALTTGGVIAGRVTAENTGAPLSQVCATAIPVHPSYYAQGFTRQAQTGADGTYAITGLSTGDYHVTFFRCFGGYDYGGEWFDDASGVNDAHAVSVVAGSTSSGVDAALSRYSMLRGRLTGAGAPLGGACVTATSTGGSFSGWAHATGDGSWSIPLPAGTYRIFYEDCDIADAHDHVAEYHSNARMESAATLVVLPAGGTVDVGLADLAVGGAVAGRLSVAAPHASLDFLDVCVSAIDPSTGAVVATTRSNTSDGTYVLRGVPVGSVKIRATDCSYFRYLVAWYGGSDETSAATLPSAAGTTTSAVDILLSRGGSLSGRVLMARDGGSAGAAPAAGVCITVNDSSGVMVSRSTTMTDGTWAAAGLPAGSYVVQFVDCSFGGLVTEWWRDASTSAAATLVVSDGSGELVVGDALLAAA